MQNTTTLESSWGFVTILTPTGTILETDCSDLPNEKCYILDIDRFDIAEFNDWFFKRYGWQPPLENIDILELGYWLKDGTYVAPSNWRYEIREELEKEGKLIVY
tara:strand:+ start:50 stop:361 length:312 start_codon:yes stop_codon:yes gene_type:complete